MEVDLLLEVQLLQRLKQNLGVAVVLHFCLVRLLRVQTEALAGKSSTDAAGSLLGAGLGDRHEL